MPLDLITIPCLQDNYAFVLAERSTGQAALIDVPEAAPISARLKAEGLNLTTVLLTHHHYDHVDGLPDLDQAPRRVIGAAADVHRLPPLTDPVRPGDSFDLLGTPVQILDVPGHTLGHIAYHLPELGLLFSGDSLMALGCGRLFEGSPADMWSSLQRLRTLPPETRVCSGHEYTATNADFACSIDPANKALISRSEAIRAARATGQATVPSLLRDEIATNPFLRADDPALAQALGRPNDSALALFTHIRALRDQW